MVNFFTTAALLAVAASPFVTAQTSTACDPTKQSCPPDLGLNQASYSVDFTKGMPSDWTMTYQSVTKDPSLGAVFTINGYDDAPTMQSNWYLFFGTVECTFQAAPGAGIVSSFILISDDLDELDVEVVGSQTWQVQSNYFGKGNTTVYDRGQNHTVTNPQSTEHVYTLDWTKDSTTWAIDGNVVRTLYPSEAVGGQNYPQTPMQIRLGNWVAGRPGNPPGTVGWAGGQADLSQAPFNFYVKSCSVTNQNPASSYTWGDESGSYESINDGQADSGSSPAPPAPSTSTTPISTPTKQPSQPAPNVPASTTPSTSSVVVAHSSTTTVTSSVHSVTEIPTSSKGSASVPFSSSSTWTSSTVSLQVGGGNSTGNSTIGGHAPTATTSGPAQVTTNAASGSYGKSTAWGLGAVMGLALLF